MVSLVFLLPTLVIRGIYYPETRERNRGQEARRFYQLHSIDAPLRSQFEYHQPSKLEINIWFLPVFLSGKRLLRDLFS